MLPQPFCHCAWRFRWVIEGPRWRYADTPHAVLFSISPTNQLRTYPCRAESPDAAASRFLKSGIKGRFVEVSEFPDGQDAIRDYQGRNFLSVGDTVLWIDPDGGVCNCRAEVSSLHADHVCLRGPGGSAIEACYHEVCIERGASVRG